MKTTFTYSDLVAQHEAQEGIVSIGKQLETVLEHSQARRKSLDPDATEDDYATEIGNLEKAIDMFHLALFWLNKNID